MIHRNPRSMHRHHSGRNVAQHQQEASLHTEVGEGDVHIMLGVTMRWNSTTPHHCAYECFLRQVSMKPTIMVIQTLWHACAWWSCCGRPSNRGGIEKPAVTSCLYWGCTRCAVGLAPKIPSNICGVGALAWTQQSNTLKAPTLWDGIRGTPSSWKNHKALHTTHKMRVPMTRTLSHCLQQHLREGACLQESGHGRTMQMRKYLIGPFKRIDLVQFNLAKHPVFLSVDLVRGCCNAAHPHSRLTHRPQQCQIIV